MKLYLAGAENPSWEKAILESGTGRTLYSYFYLLSNLKAGVGTFIRRASSALRRDIFVDSGGYSAWSRGAKIDIGEYSDFLLGNLSCLTSYAVLDVIGDPKKTEQNQRYMEGRGLKPLPVFHASSPYEVLKDLATEYDHLCLGGLVPYARNKRFLNRHLGACFNITSSTVRVHGFGITSPDIMRAFPFYSVDSTSWLGGSKRASVFCITGEQMRYHHAHSLKGAMKLHSLQWTDNGKKLWFARVTENARVMAEYERFLTKLWAERGVLWGD